MATCNYEYWPFSVGPVEGSLPEQTEKTEFLEAAFDQGYESFRFGINDYGARSDKREGCILERGRNRWEIRLAEGERRRLLAFVDEFQSAGHAVNRWLGGSCAKEVLDSIHDRLVTPPGAKTSHVITEEDCPA